MNHDLKVLSIIFNWAVKQDLIKNNPVNGIERFSISKKYPRFFSPEEARLILRECAPCWYPAYMILLHTGIRKGELTNLEWNDVDFDRMIIRITSKESWSPKGKRDREVPIDDELLKIFEELKQKSKGKYVIVLDGIKQDQYGWILWDNFRKLTKQLGIERVNIHTFRHTFASYLVMDGVPLATVMDILGHRDIKTTMRYANLATGHKHWAVSRISSILRSKTKMDTNWVHSEKFVM